MNVYMLKSIVILWCKGVLQAYYFGPKVYYLLLVHERCLHIKALPLAKISEMVTLSIDWTKIIQL